jgi:D-sedoheptulose 7-phosphate isomerase
MKDNFLFTVELIKEFVNNDENIKNIENAGDLISECLLNDGRVFSCGNGGSMSDAMHFAEELTGNFKTKRKAFSAIAISDPAHITCVANDFGFDFIFSRYLEAHGRKGDVLLAISTSGNSKNILNAALQAKSIGMKIVGLTGKDGGKLKEFCDVEIRVPYFGYSDRIQELHIMVIHNLIEYIESKIIK